jgi:threonine dehydratase
MARLKVGRTPLRKSIEMCGRCNGATVYFKDESKNPFGTFKDRRTAAILDKAIKSQTKREDGDPGKLLFVHITSGNSGYSLGMMAGQVSGQSDVDIEVVNIIPKGLSKRIKKQLDRCSTVVEMDLGKRPITQEEMHELAKEATCFDGPDSNILGVEDYNLLDGYRKIIHEIADDDINPDYIFCPFGEGELAVELAQEASNAWDNPPVVVGVTIPENVIGKEQDFLKKASGNIADKLVNAYSKFRELFNGLLKEGLAGLMTIDSEKEISHEYGYLNSIGIDVEPSAAVAFCGAEKYGLSPDDTAVIINTGKGVFDKGSLNKLWRKRLVKAGRYLAVAAIAAVATFGVGRYKEYLEREKRFLELQRQEVVMQIEDETLKRVVSEASHAADNNGNGIVGRSEYEAMLKFIPGRESDDIPDAAFYDIHLLDFKESELRFFARYKQNDRFPDNFSRDAQTKLMKRFLEEIEDNESEPSISERHKRIYRLRRVMVHDDNGSFCTFRQFDIDNPFDPEKEETCNW